MVVHTLVKILGTPEREFETACAQLEGENLQLAVVDYGICPERVDGYALAAAEQQHIAELAHRGTLAHCQIVSLYTKHSFERGNEDIHIGVQLAGGAKAA